MQQTMRNILSRGFNRAKIGISSTDDRAIDLLKKKHSSSRRDKLDTTCNTFMTWLSGELGEKWQLTL
jgi:hypothetical protein